MYQRMCKNDLDKENTCGKAQLTFPIKGNRICGARKGAKSEASDTTGRNLEKFRFATPK